MTIVYHKCYYVNMALFMTNPGKKSELQKRLVAELREKAAKTAQIENDPPDGVEDSNYVKNYKQTTSLAWVWALILAAFVVIVIVIAIMVR